MSRSQATFAKMQREIRKAEAVAHEANLRKLRAQEITGPVQDTGTGQTILKLQRHQPPLRTLVEAKKIGAVELAAADQIAQAVTAVCSRGHLAAALLERIAHGRQGDNPWPAEIALAVRNYQRWQNHWSDEWKRTRNPMCQVIWSAVIDEHPISVIANDIGYGRTRTARAIICGIRHYAAWANMVVGIQRAAWIAAAQQVFNRTATATSN